MGKTIRWMGLVALTAAGCLGRVSVEPTACEPATAQPCGGGGSGNGGAGGGGSGGHGGHHSARLFGDAERQHARNVAVDGSNNILLIGDGDGTLDFGGGPLSGPLGFRDVYLAKLDPSLNHLRSKVFGDGSSQTIFGIAADAADNVLLTGEFQGSIDFGGGPLTGIGDIDLFVAKLDPGLGHLYSKSFGDPEQTASRGIVADAAGNVVVTGYFRGSVDLGGGTLKSAGGDDVFLVKFDPQLGHLHSKSFGSAENQDGYGVALDAAGNIVVAGHFENTIDFGGGPLKSAGNMDVFVAKFDAKLNHLWSRSFGDADLQILWRVAVDSADNVVLAGYFGGSLDFGGDPLESGGELDAFVAKLDPQLQHIASRRFGGAGSQIGFGIATDGAGNVVVAGSFTDSIDFGGGPLKSADSYDLFAAKLDPQLEHIWSKRFGEDGDQQALAVALDGAGNVILTGEANGSVDFGEGPLKSAGDADIFVAKLPP